MAAPCVSGVMALLRAEFPGESYRQLFNRLYASVERLPALADKCRTGGRVNLARALGSVSSAPGNDSFANRLSVNLDNFRIAGINVDATAESREPAHAGNPAARSIWWSWKPSLRGVATLSTAGSSFNTTLAVYTGTSVSSLTLVAANDDDPASGQTPAGSASTRILRLTTPSPWTAWRCFGQRRLEYCAAEAPSTTISPAIFQSSVRSRQWPVPIPSPRWSRANRSCGAARGRLRVVVVDGSRFRTCDDVHGRKFVQHLARGLHGHEVVEPEDRGGQRRRSPGGTNTSRVSFTAVAGTTYHIAVDGYLGASGSIVLRTPPLNDHFVHRISIPGAASTIVGYNELASKEPLEPNHAGNAGGKSLWWSWACPASGPVTISTRAARSTPCWRSILGRVLGL